MSDHVRPDNYWTDPHQGLGILIFGAVMAAAWSIPMVRMWREARREAAGRCQRPPRGWLCLRNPGHTGPCPTWPGWWNLRGKALMRRG